MATPDDHGDTTAPITASAPPLLARSPAELYLYFKYGGVTLAVVLVLGLVITLLVVRANKADAQARATAYALFDGAFPAKDDSFRDPKKAAAAAAKRSEDLAKVTTLYPSSPAAVDSQFLVAQAEFEQGHYEVAAKQYGDFVAQHADRQPQASLARLGQANALLALGRAADALPIFRTAADATAAKASPAIVPFANFQAAVCAIQLGDQEAAKGFLNAVLAGGAEQSLSNRAQGLLTRLTLLPLAKPAGSAPAVAPGTAAAPAPAK